MLDMDGVTNNSAGVVNDRGQQGKKRRVAIVGYGNIGRHALDALLEAPDLEPAGVVRRNASDRADIDAAIPVVGDIAELGRIDAAVLCVPTRQVPTTAEGLLAAGVNTVDSYDIHGQPLVDLRARLGDVARTHGTVAMLSAGWDPGTDSVVRALFEAMAPAGITHTNFGPGVSMGHSTVVRAIDGVEDAISITVPQGTGVHRRLVYVQLHNEADFDTVRSAILNDAYFKHDDTRVQQVNDVRSLMDVGHGVRIERKGVSGRTHNQQIAFDMRINNPALTAQIMVAAARATFRQQPGAYTLLEVPIIDCLAGERDELLRRLV